MGRGNSTDMAVFKVDEKFRVVLNPEAVKLVPELEVLTDDELLYVILVADYEDSPFRNKPLAERKYMAAKRVYKMDYSEEMETQAVISAISGYRGLVFDIRRETRETFQRRLAIIQKDIFDKDLTLKRLKEIDDMIKYIEDRIDNINLSLKQTERGNVQLKGQTSLSFIEEWQRNQQNYKKFLETDG